MELSLIGSGKLGQQLYREFAKHSSIKLIQWINRSADLSSIQGINIADSLNSLKEVDLLYVGCN